MENLEIGIVIEVENNVTKVKLNKHSDCKNCGTCPGNDAAVVEAVNDVNAVPGQRVMIEVKENNVIKIAFVIFILPLIAVFIGSIIGKFIADKIAYNGIWLTIFGGVAGLLLSIFYIRHVDKVAKATEKMQYVIKKII